jgi:hypothetical protein
MEGKGFRFRHKLLEPIYIRREKSVKILSQKLRDILYDLGGLPNLFSISYKSAN